MQSTTRAITRPRFRPKAASQQTAHGARAPGCCFLAPGSRSIGSTPWSPVSSVVVGSAFDAWDRATSSLITRHFLPSPGRGPGARRFPARDRCGRPAPPASPRPGPPDRATSSTSLETSTIATPVGGPTCAPARRSRTALPRRLPGSVSSSSSTRQSRSSQRARTTFCWLPPDRLRTGCFDPCRPYVERPGQHLGGFPLGPFRSGNPALAKPPEGGRRLIVLVPPLRRAATPDSSAPPEPAQPQPVLRFARAPA